MLPVQISMTWQCIDALELIEDLKTKCDTQAQEDAIGTAKTLWQAGEQAQAFELLVHVGTDNNAAGSATTAT